MDHYHCPSRLLPRSPNHTKSTKVLPPFGVGWVRTKEHMRIGHVHFVGGRGGGGHRHFGPFCPNPHQGRKSGWAGEGGGNLLSRGVYRGTWVNTFDKIFWQEKKKVLPKFGPNFAQIFPGFARILPNLLHRKSWEAPCPYPCLIHLYALEPPPPPRTSLIDAYLLHLPEDVILSDGCWRLLDDLLMTSLDGAVSAEQGDGVSILVSKELDLQMTSTAYREREEQTNVLLLLIWQSPGLPGWRKVNLITVTRRPLHPSIAAGFYCLTTSPGFLPALCEKWSGFFYVHRVWLSYTRDRRLKVSSERLGNEDKAPCPRALLPGRGSNRGPPVWKSEVLTARPRQLLLV